MIGDLKAAIETLQELQQYPDNLGNSAALILDAGAAATWQKAWQQAADAKDTGNELFRRGDFMGNTSSSVACLLRVSMYRQPLHVHVSGWLT